MSPPGAAVRALLRRVRDEGCTGCAFVAGWKVDGRTEAAAFRRGLIEEAGGDLWSLTPSGRAAVEGLR